MMCILSIIECFGRSDLILILKLFPSTCFIFHRNLSFSDVDDTAHYILILEKTNLSKRTVHGLNPNFCKISSFDLRATIMLEIPDEYGVNVQRMRWKEKDKGKDKDKVTYN